MDPTTIGLLGASGELGRRVAQALQGSATRSRLIVRDLRRAASDFHEVVLGDMDQPSTLAAAFAGLETLVLITADTPRQAEQGLAAIDAARRAGVRRIVMVSAMLAGEAAPRSFAARHARIESALQGSGLEYVILRPSFFMQSLRLFTDFRRGKMTVPVPTGRVALVDAEDVARAVVACVLARTWRDVGGRVHVLTGDESVSFGEAAHALTRGLGVSVQHRAPPLWVARLMLPWVVGRPTAAMLAFLFERLEAGREAMPTPDLQRLIGQKPLTLAECLAREPAGFRRQA